MSEFNKTGTTSAYKTDAIFGRIFESNGSISRQKVYRALCIGG
jgi:hypothetical protein